MVKIRLPDHAEDIIGIPLSKFLKDGICIDVKTQNGGKYFTTLPISDKKYRLENPGRATAQFKKPRTIIITDDWGNDCEIVFSHEDSWLESSLKILREENLLVEN